MNIGQQLHRWRVQLLAQKQKFGVIALLFMVALLLWGRLLLKAVPRTATAVPDFAASVLDGDADNQNLGPKKDRVVYVDLPSAASRNLFRFDPSGYQPSQVRNTLKDEEKSGPLPDDQDVRLAEAREAAEGLLLQSTVPGDSPYAVINGMVVQVGKEVDGFRLLKVEDRTVVLEYNGISFKLKM